MDDEFRDPHDRPYRREDFTEVQYRPMSTLERATRKLVAAGIVTVLMIAAAAARHVWG